MKKRVLALAVVVCLSMAVTACGKEQQHDIIESETHLGDEQMYEPVDNTQNVTGREGEEASNQEVESNREDMSSQEEVAPEESESNKEEVVPEEPAPGLTFADLSTKRFDFSSGIGAWNEEFTIEKDGYFTGNFHDINMGDTGEGYPDGTFNGCWYSGHFTELTKVGEYVYEMKLKDISYKDEPGTEEILDGMKYVNTEAYFMASGDTFQIYLPGMPLSEVSEEIYWWVRDYNQSESELTGIVIVNEEDELAAVSVNRFAPSEDAQMTYNAYKESFDYWAGKLTNEALTTLEMVEYSGRMYEVSDDCLNELWNLIRYNVPEDKYVEILEEQRAWIKEKEEKAKKIADVYAGGSMASVDINDTLAQLTMERCAKLVEYLQ